MMQMHALGRWVALAVLLPAPAIARESLCVDHEHAVFSCKAGGKQVSLCASADLDADSGTLYYRFGTPAKVELRYPEEARHPRTAYTRGVLGGLGGGTDFVSFAVGAYRYTVYSSFSKSHSEDGLTVHKNGQLVRRLVCAGPALVPAENWTRVYQADLPVDHTLFDGSEAP